jgi:hypothetical protein
LNRIQAGNLVIGDTSKSGNITISNVTTTTASTGNLTLQTSGNITFSKALTVGDDPLTVGITESTKNLTLNASGAASTIAQSEAIKASGLELLGANAAYTLTRTDNLVTTLAANAKSINLVNSSSLLVDTVNNTQGISATGDVSVKTNSGNLSLAQNITTTGNVTLDAAGAIAQTNGNISASLLKLKAGTTIGAADHRIQTNVSSLSMDSGGDQFLTEANALTMAAKTTNNGSVDVETTNGTLTIGTVNSIAGVTAHGSGDVELAGVTNSGDGIYIGQNITANGGTVNITGTTSNLSYPNAGIRSAMTVSAKNITMFASATGAGSGALGYFGAGGVFTASEQLNLSGNASGSGNGFYSYTGSFTSGTGMSISGISASGQGVGLDNLITLTNGNTGTLSITGTSGDASKQAIGLRGTAFTNGGGDTLLTAVNANIFTSSGNPAWNTGVHTNTITNNGTGAVRITAGNNNATNSGAIDGSVLSITQNAAADVLIRTSGIGNITAPKVINNGTGDVVVAAGTAIAAGVGAGGQVLTRTGNTIKNDAGNTYIIQVWPLPLVI